MSLTTIYVHDSRGNLIPVEVDVAGDPVEIGRRIKAALAEHDDDNLTPTINTFPQSDSKSVAEPAGGRSTERTGVAPADRDAAQIASLNDLNEIKKLAEKRAYTTRWLSTSDAGTAEPQLQQRDQRGISTGEEHQQAIPNLREAPSQGSLSPSRREALTPTEVDHHNERTESRSSLLTPESSSPVTGEDHLRGITDEDYFHSATEMAEQAQEPYAHQFVGRSPPNEPRRADSTANANIMSHRQKVAEWDAQSRTATVGSKKTIESIYDGSSMKDLSLGETKSRERGATFTDKVKSLMPRRSSSKLSHKKEHSPTESPAEEIFGDSRHKRGVSVSSLMPPDIDSTSAYLNSNSVDTNGYLTTTDRRTSDIPEASGATSPLNRLRRSFSKGEKRKSFTETGSTPHIVGLMRREGGPPVSTALVSPLHEQYTDLEEAAAAAAPSAAVENEEIDDDDEEDEEDAQLGLGNSKGRFKDSSEDLGILTIPITPNLDGFKEHALHLNPQMEPFLADRIAHEQLRRYKDLVSHKVKHAQDVYTGRCASVPLCLALGGLPTYLPARSNNKGEKTQVFFMRGHRDSGEAEANGATVATFQRGVPEPPVSQLPATFECSLCFKERKAVNKPSDWTKHVHEDLQPFTCTFKTCSTEKKSFKRKADWVRHENECHRHLEQWRCNYAECQHVCYRSDNFSQHLIREHKVPDWKNKTRGSTSSKLRAQTATQNGQEEELMAMLHRICRSTSSDKPESEPCVFCKVKSPTWKKHQVHLSRHMESIAMPVLTLVEQHEGSRDTIISPIKREQVYPVTGKTTIADVVDPLTLTPFSTNGSSFHQGSSASQSPMGMPLFPQAQLQFVQYPANADTFSAGLPTTQSAMGGSHFSQQPTATTMGGGTFGPFGYGPSPAFVNLDSFNQSHAVLPSDSSAVYEDHAQMHFANINSNSPSTYPPPNLRKSPAQSQLQPPISYGMSNQASGPDYMSSPHSGTSYHHSTSPSPHQMRASPMRNQLEIPRSQAAGNQMLSYNHGDYSGNYAFTEQQDPMQSPLETELYPDTFQQSIEGQDYLATTGALGYENMTATSTAMADHMYEQQRRQQQLQRHQQQQPQYGDCTVPVSTPHSQASYRY